MPYGPNLNASPPGVRVSDPADAENVRMRQAFEAMVAGMASLVPTKALLARRAWRGRLAWQELQDLLALQGRRDCKAWPERQALRDLLAQLDRWGLPEQQVHRDCKARRGCKAPKAHRVRRVRLALRVQ